MVGTIVAAIYVFVRGVQAGSFAASELVHSIDNLLLISVATELSLIVMVVLRCRRLGDGDITRGLAAGRIARSRVFFWMLVAQLVLAAATAWLLFRWPAFREGILHGMHFALARALENGPIAVAGTVLDLVFLAPVCEEFFFRGWLWTALRRHWNVWPVAVVTSGLWLLLHVSQGWLKLLYLMPLAVALSLVRHYTGTVRSTILLHSVNNARSVIASLAAWWMA